MLEFTYGVSEDNEKPTKKKVFIVLKGAKHGR